MRAILLHGPRRLEVDDIPIPNPPKGWVLVRSLLSGICGTDKAFYTGAYKLFKTPLVPGHEVVGVIEEGPEEMDTTRRVVVSEINFSCGLCEYCRLGMYTHCPEKVTLGIDFDGGMAEYFIAPREALHYTNLNPELAIFVEPLAAILRAFSLKPVRPGDRVAVIGTGNVAFLTVQLLRYYGVRVDLVARRESSKIGYFKSYVEDIIYVDEVENLDYDVVFEASGDPNALDLAITLVRPLGVIHLKSTPGARSNANMTMAVVKEVEIVGSRCGTFREFREAIRLLERGVIKPRLDKIYDIDRAEEAFEEALTGKYLKIAIKP